MPSNESKFQQTKGTFRLRGIVQGLDRDNAYRAGYIESGNLTGREYRSINFGVQTDKHNVIYVELFGVERDEVYAYNSRKKEGQKFPWDKRFNLPDGYAIISVIATLERDENGKPIREHMTEFDAVDYIREHLRNGDSVEVRGDLRYDRYTTESGEDRTRVRYVIRQITKLKDPIDFDAEGFEPMAAFEQEIVAIGSDLDKENKKLFLSAYVIDYGDRFAPVQFVVDGNTHPKLAQNIYKKLKGGDFIKLYGLLINSVETTEVAAAEEDDWGGEIPFGYQVITRRVNEMRVVGVDPASYQPKKYNLEDFVMPEPEEDENPFAGGSDDFGSSDGDSGLGDDDLPF